MNAVKLPSLFSKVVKSLYLLLLFSLVPFFFLFITPPVSSHFQQVPILQGRVVNEADQPQSGAQVSIFVEGNFVQSILTTNDGVFNIILPRPGECSVTISVDGFRTQTETLTVNKDETLFHIFKLIPSSLHVVVLDAVQDKLSDAVVTLKGDDGGLKRAIESPKGDYYFGRLKPGIYQLTVLMPGFEISVDDGIYIAADSKTMLRTVLLQRASAIPISDKLKERYLMPLLPANAVETIWQDRITGEIWLGTNRGVTRFSGSDLKSSDSQDVTLSTFAGLEVKLIFQDSKGQLWFVTKDGLRIKKVDSHAIEPMTFLPKGREVRAITEDRLGALWFATNAGVISYFDGKMTQFTTRQGLPTDDVRYITIDKSGETLLVATSAGVISIVHGRVKLLTAKGETPNWPTNYILEDSRGIIWFLTEFGLRKLQNDQITSLQRDPFTQTFVMAVEDRVGNLWFAAKDRGVYVYDLRRDEIDDQLGSDKVMALLADQEGNIWFGTENGAVRQDFYSFVNFNTSRGLPEMDIRCLVPDPAQSGALWVGSSTGLIHYDGTSFRRIVSIPATVTVNHIFYQEEGKLWVATSDGLYRLKNEQWRRFSTESGLLSNDVRYFVADVADGNFWVATSKGVSRFDTKLDTPTTITPEPLNITAQVRHIYQQPNRLLWFATDRGVYRYDPITYDLTVIGQNDGLESIDVRWIEGDEAAGVLWFATAKGIEIFKGQRIVPDRRLPGLTGENIQCIFRDRDQMIWLGSTDGKVKKYVNTRLPNIPPLINTYTRDRHGLAGNEIRAIAQDSNGAIWFATEGGLTRHIPSHTVPHIDYHIEVNGAETFSNEIEAGRHNIKFRFEGISSLGDISFIHRIIINGQAKDYRLISSQSGDIREALFNNLPPGDHIFEIKVVNRDLYGINAKPLAIPIHIDRPFWQKSWFYIFIGLTLIGMTAGSMMLHNYQQREYRLPTHLRTFVPIDPNPYIVGNPIRTPSMFFGREDDFNYLKIKLEGTAQGGVVLVFCGERRAGKSSILYQILNERLGDRYIPVFIDLQEMVVSQDREFFGRIAKITTEAVFQEDISTSGSAQHRLAEYPFADASKNAFHLFADFMDFILAKIGDRRLIIMMDEYELLENKVQEGKLSKEIFAFMASLIENRERLSFVFTGSRRLDERDRRYWRELLRRSLFRKVSFLSERDAKRLITDPVQDKIVYGRGVVDQIYHLTYGQPFYTQYICQSIVDHLNEWKRNYVLKEDIKLVINEMVDNPLPQMIYFWDGFSDDEKIVMSLLSEVLRDGEDVVTAARIAEAIKREHYPVALSTDTIRLTLEELFRHDVLKKMADDAFCFRIDLFRIWIKKSHSIWRVVREVRVL